MANTTKKQPTNPTTAGIKVFASKSCSSLSGNCTIAYKLGLDENNALHIRLHDNTGGGFFNKDWVPAQKIADVLQDATGPDPVSSRVLATLFQRRSANTPAFFAAVLRNEGVFLPYKKTARYHLVGDLNAFVTQGTSNTSRAKISPRKKTPVKKKTSSRSKSKATPAK